MDARSFEWLKEQGAFEAEPMENPATSKAMDVLLKMPFRGNPKEKPRLSIEELQIYLREIGVTVRYNQISAELEIKGVPGTYNPEALANEFPTIVYDALADCFVCQPKRIAEFLAVIGGMNRYNPVLDLLNNIEWDGCDRVGELIEILGLEQDDKLSRTLIFKWLCQCVALADNDDQRPFGADGMLVLQGPQGIGKTTVVRVLGFRSDLFKLGQFIDARDKDTLRRCCTGWIVELAEIESTMRGDAEKLKAFVTSEFDQYRLPYARTDEKRPRRTSLIGTCNSNQFLADPTGSRRFWVVPVEKIDLDRLNKLDVLQLWAEVKKLFVDVNKQCFRLTEEERAELAERNCKHEKPVKGQAEVQDIIYDARQNENAYVWKPATVSDFKESYNTLRNYSVEAIGAALSKLGIEQPYRKKIDGKSKQVRDLPFKVTHCSWLGDK